MNTNSESKVGVVYIAPPEPLSFMQRIGHYLFPRRYCDQPKFAGYIYPEMITIRTRVVLDWKDRIRVLVTGNLLIETRTACEHVVGNTQTQSMVEVQPPKFLK